MAINLGEFTLQVFRGRSRWDATHVKLQCDAIAIRNGRIMFTSIIGPESAIKAVRAVLQSENDERTNVNVKFDKPKYLYRTNLQPTNAPYTCHAHQLFKGLWHFVAVSKTPGLLLTSDNESIWNELQSENWTTPIIRPWLPYIIEQMREHRILTDLDQVGCPGASILNINTTNLDAIITKGIREHKLVIPGTRGLPKATWPENLDTYMLRYGAIIGKQAERSLEPLHVPGRDATNMPALLRVPFDAQAHVIAATRKALDRQKAINIVAEMGTGKTLMAMSAIHARAAGNPYRALVFCPGQLCQKWGREITETLPGARIHQLETWKDVIAINRNSASISADWYVIARDRAKLGARWSPVYSKIRRRDNSNNFREYLTCPSCGKIIVDADLVPIQAGVLTARRTHCEYVRNRHNQEAARGCGAPLWTMNRELWRYEPALYIKRRLHKFFDYLVIDEAHEEKSATSAQGNAAGALAAASKKVIALTGTLIGGYADHTRPLLFRLSPQSLVSEGLTWNDATLFNERYGRIDTITVEKDSASKRSNDNRESRGQTKTTTRKAVRPGIMPGLYGRHLIDKAVFLSLSEVSDNLPTLHEEMTVCQMDAEQARAYRKIEEDLMTEIKKMLVRRDTRLLGKMLQTLLAYPDHPFGWEPVGYNSGGCFVPVADPQNLNPSVIRPKEQTLIDICQLEKYAGRQVWVFTQYTDTYDVQHRLETILKRAGLRVGSLRSSVTLAKREEWIARHGPNVDVMVSHPRLVETGLDLFDKSGRYNFPTLVFYGTGYNLFTLRQASRRAWRIGQDQPCNVFYLYYGDTMQERAMALMGKKLSASQALEGRFSTEGLVAMGGEEGSVEIALAKSLVARMDEGDVRRAWGRIGSERHNTPRAVVPQRQIVLPPAPTDAGLFSKFLNV